MKKILNRILILLVLFSFVGCHIDERSNAEEEQERATKRILEEINAQIGMPTITNFQEKKLAKMIFELRDKSELVTYAYIVNLQGSLVYLGQCVGFGLPYSVQYTNPMRIAEEAVNDPVVPQADPNGLYMPEGLSATWLMMYDEETGEVRPVYVEPEIIVSPFKLH